MAIYHFSVGTVSRKAGRSAVRSAAYITGTRRVDERTGRVFNYTRKAAEVLATGTFGSVNWQETERAERRKDSKVARSIIMALPCELKLWALCLLVRGYVAGLRLRHGMAGEWAIHEAPGDARNIHVHVLMTTREVDRHGVHGCKLRALDCPATSRPIIKRWRLEWEQACNRVLAQHHIVARVDCRSLEERGIERPARQHLGPERTQQQRRGYRAAAVRHNARVDELERANAELARVNDQIRQAAVRKRRERTGRQVMVAQRRRPRRDQRTSAASIIQDASVPLPPSPASVLQGQNATVTTRRRMAPRR